MTTKLRKKQGKKKHIINKNVCNKIVQIVESYTMCRIFLQLIFSFYKYEKKYFLPIKKTCQFISKDENEIIHCCWVMFGAGQGL